MYHTNHKGKNTVFGTFNYAYVCNTHVCAFKTLICVTLFLRELICATLTVIAAQSALFDRHCIPNYQSVMTNQQRV
jgi:hypothetical protein